MGHDSMHAKYGHEAQRREQGEHSAFFGEDVVADRGGDHEGQNRHQVHRSMSARQEVRAARPNPGGERGSQATVPCTRGDCVRGTREEELPQEVDDDEAVRDCDEIAYQGIPGSGWLVGKGDGGLARVQVRGKQATGPRVRPTHPRTLPALNFNHVGRAKSYAEQGLQRVLQGPNA